VRVIFRYFQPEKAYVEENAVARAFLSERTIATYTNTLTNNT